MSIFLSWSVRSSKVFNIFRVSSETDGVLVNHDLLCDIFPKNYNDKIKHFKINNKSEDTLVFESEMRVNVKIEHLSVSQSVSQLDCHTFT